MTHSYETLKGKTVAQLRDIAEGFGEHEQLHGYRTMHKEELLPALCHALGIEDHTHHEVIGLDKARIKARIGELKAIRDAALEARDLDEYRAILKQIHRLKGKLRRAVV